MDSYNGVPVPAGGAQIEVKDGKFIVPDKPILPFIEGDGTGPDIWRASRTVFDAAVKLASNASAEAEGLYWETKSAQKLATQSLARASAADPGSPKLHVLLGDIYRQQKAFPDSEQEYRKALALQPADSGALFGLSLALLADGQNDEALAIAQTALEKDPGDPELNAVMGEILCARDDFSGAEPYLKKSLNTKPEFVSRVHALLGKVYAPFADNAWTPGIVLTSAGRSRSRSPPRIVGRSPRPPSTSSGNGFGTAQKSSTRRRPRSVFGP